MNTKTLFLSLILLVFVFSGTGLCVSSSLNKIDYGNDINDDYWSEKWAMVDHYINAGLPKSAFKLVEEIYLKAKGENNAPNYVRAIIYKIKIGFISGKFDAKIIDMLKAEIESSGTPVKQILSSMLAEVFDEYCKKTYWSSYNIIKTRDDISDNILLMSIGRIRAEQDKYYKLSISDADNLVNYKIVLFYDIIKDHSSQYLEDSLNINYTLYDFLIDKAINHYTNFPDILNYYISDFEIFGDSYFQPADKFVNINIPQIDTSSSDYYAILYLQNAIKMHLNDENPNIMIDFDYKRLLFLKSKSEFDDKEGNFLKAVESLLDKYSTSPIYSTIAYNTAANLSREGNSFKKYNYNNDKIDLKRALEYCNRAISKFPKSAGSEKCSLLKSKIEEKELEEIEIENYNIPGKPFEVSVKYRNLEKMYVKVIKTDIKELMDLPEELFDDKKGSRSETDNKIIDYFNDKKPEKQFTVNIPQTGDYFSHSIPIVIPALEKGDYVILISTGEHFSVKDDETVYGITSLTNISFIFTRNNEYQFYVLDRESGKPLANLDVKIHITGYDLSNDKYEIIDKEIINDKTDANGYLKVKSFNKNENFYLEFFNGDDYMCTLDKNKIIRKGKFNKVSFMFYELDTKEKEEKKLFVNLFTDRKIYRPGQTLFFKGIMAEKSGDDYEVVPNRYFTVMLKNTNGFIVDSLSLLSNEFGSINGFFKIPTTGLTGEFELLIDGISGYSYIFVEEYKRPKFEVIIDDIENQYRLGDTITIKGRAKTYSGSNLSNADVKYSITRKDHNNYHSQIRYLTNGKTVTDEKGEFVVKFIAKPNLAELKSGYDYFIFELNAEITDINGETRSNNKTIHVYKNSLNLSALIPGGCLNRNSANKIELLSANYDGAFVPAEGKIKISKLINLEKPLITRQMRGDIELYSKVEFKRLFPELEYQNEWNYENREIEKTIKEITYNTSIEKFILLEDLDKWEQGAYKFEMESVDAYGEQVKENIFFTLYDDKSMEMPYNDTYILYYNTKAVYSVGDTAEIIIGSSFSDVHILYEIIKGDKLLSRRWVNLNNEKKLLKIPIEKDFSDDINVQFFFVRNNHIFKPDINLSVRNLKENLDISFETFRNKLHPGENEEWKIKIKNKDGFIPNSEMTTALYDKSLDLFIENTWNFIFEENWYHYYKNWSDRISFDFERIKAIKNKKDYYDFQSEKNGLYFDWFGFNFNSSLYDLISVLTGGFGAEYGSVLSGIINVSKYAGVVPNDRKQIINIRGGRSTESIVIVDGIETTNPYDYDDKNLFSSKEEEMINVQTRKNFDETAFFYPELVTDKDGNITVKFQVPEALTKWKMLGFAHTKNLDIGYISNELVTSKEFSIMPNIPRFFREGDKVSFSVKLVNSSEKDIAGTVQLDFYNAINSEKLNIFQNSNNPDKNFTIKKGESIPVDWNIVIPESLEAIRYKIVAKSENFSDGEEMIIPVLPNRTLVTETLPFSVNPGETKKITLDKLVNNNSSSLQSHSLTFEFTSNPTWYAIQSLPYLMEYPHECSEQVFSRFYSNSVASYLVNSDPKIKSIFEDWKNLQPDALSSNLEKNTELKNILLEDSPWIRDAKNESDRKRRLGILFDTKRLLNEQYADMSKLKALKISNSGFPWFPGMKPDRYISQHIAIGLARLLKMGVLNKNIKDEVTLILKELIDYLDSKTNEAYNVLLNNDRLGYLSLSDRNIGSLEIHYLYLKSICKDIKHESVNTEAFKYYTQQAKQYWTKENTYLKGLIALAMYNFYDKDTPDTIVKSLKETSISNDELGMYWQEGNSFYWYEDPLERQATMIEVFNVIAKDENAVNEMKKWLLKNKQTNNWETTKSTVDACYALLLSGDKILSDDVNVNISVGDIKIDPINSPDLKVESGSGYFKKIWQGENVNSSMGNITVENNNKNLSWGGIYWQYFEQYDKISASNTNLKIEKKLYVEKVTDKGKELVLINNKISPAVGDIVIAQFIIYSDRDYEYVSLKDLRASCFEPLNVFSSYKYQNGLGYYECTRDASSNFYFDRLPQGTFVIQYPMRVTHKGNFMNGITDIQCMYAPEFSAHIGGNRIQIVE